MIYKEPYIIPAELFENSQVIASAKILWGYMTKFQKSKKDAVNKELAQLLGVTNRGLIKIKAHLAEHGYLEKRIEKGQIRYLPIDPALKAQKRIESFMQTSHFFRNIPANQLLLMLNQDADRLMYTLEVLEWTYLKAPAPPIYPDRLIRKTFKTGVTPPPDFKPGFWERELQKKAALKASNQVKSQKKEAEKAERGRDLKFAEWLSQAKKPEIKKLTDAARARMNGDYQEGPLGDLALKIKMQEIWEDQHEER